MSSWPSPHGLSEAGPRILRRRSCRTGDSTMVWAKGWARIGCRSRSLQIFLLLVITFVGLMDAAAATTHYVAANGSDSNNGTSTSTPWLHAPGMPSCSGSCASYTPQAGDRFIFRGGTLGTSATADRRHTREERGRGRGMDRAGIRSTLGSIKRGSPERRGLGRS